MIEESYKKILFLVFGLFLHVESSPPCLCHQYWDTLYL